MELFRGQGKNIRRVAVSLIAAFLISILLLLGFAFLLLKLQPDTGKTEMGILTIYVLSCFAGGWISGRKADRRKFLWGLLTGILYFFLLLVVSAAGETTLSPELTRTVIAFVLCAGGGMLGGMLA